MEHIPSRHAAAYLLKALPGEPVFGLMGRDPCAPTTIRHWADQRAQRGVEGDHPQDAEQISEALEIADQMEVWRAENDGAWRESAAKLEHEAIPSDEISSIAGRILGMDNLRTEAIEAGVPISGQKFASLLTDARRLAAFVLARDPQAGPNRD